MSSLSTLFLLSLIFLSISLVSSFKVDCQQSRVSGRTTSDSTNINTGDLLFDFYSSPAAGENQLMTVAGGVNNWVLSETVTNGELEFDIYPPNDNTPGVYPQLAVSLNGAWLVNPQTNSTIWNTNDAELALTFSSGFLGDGSADAYNEIALSVFAYYYMNGYSTCSMQYKFNITNPAFA